MVSHLISSVVQQATPMIEFYWVLFRTYKIFSLLESLFNQAILASIFKRLRSIIVEI